MTMKLFDFRIKDPYEAIPYAWCGIFASRHYSSDQISSIVIYFRSPFSKRSRYVDVKTMDWTEGRCSFLRFISVRMPYKAYIDGKYRKLYKGLKFAYAKEWTMLPE